MGLEVTVSDDDLTTKRACELVRDDLGERHLFGVCRDVLTDVSVTTGNGTGELPIHVLTVERGTVELVHNDKDFTITEAT